MSLPTGTLQITSASVAVAARRLMDLYFLPPLVTVPAPRETADVSAAACCFLTFLVVCFSVLAAFLVVSALALALVVVSVSFEVVFLLSVFFAALVLTNSPET